MDMSKKLLGDIADKVDKGIRLSREDGIAMMESPDLIQIGRLVARAHGHSRRNALGS